MKGAPPVKRLLLALFLALGLSAPGYSSVTETIPRVQYVSSGSATYLFSWPIWASTEIQAYIGDTLQPTSAYSVTFTAGSASGGSVTFVSAPAAGATVTLRRDSTQARTTDFATSGPFSMATLNSQIDRLTGQIQDLQEQTNRAAKLKPTTADADNQAPNLPEFAGAKVLGWNAEGEFTTYPTSIPAAEISGTAADTTTASTIRGMWYVSTSTAVTNHGNASQAGGLAWIKDQIGTNHTWVNLPPATYTLGSSLDTGIYMHLIFQPGAVITVGTGATLTFSAPPEIGRWKVFTLVGTGAVTGLAEVRPEWFGAISDGVTSSTNAAAFAAAVAAIPSTGGTLRVDGGGTFMFPVADFVQLKSGVSMVGDHATTIKKVAGAAILAEKIIAGYTNLVLGAALPAASNMGIHNMILEGGGISFESTANAIVNVEVDGCRIQNITGGTSGATIGPGVKTSWTVSQARIFRNVFTNIDGGGVIAGSDDTDVSYNQFENVADYIAVPPGLDGQAHAIYISGSNLASGESKKVRVNGNHIHDSNAGWGIHVNGGAIEVTVNDNIVDTGTTCIFVGNTDSSVNIMRSISVVGNVCENATSDGIMISGWTGNETDMDIVVANNTVKHTGRSGIVMAGVNGGVISGNILDDVMYGAYSTHSAIELIISSKNLSVTGNVIRNSNAGTGTAEHGNGIYAKYLESAVISGNVIDSVVGDGIHLADSTEVSVHNNRVKNARYGTHISGASSEFSLIDNTAKGCSRGFNFDLSGNPRNIVVRGNKAPGCATEYENTTNLYQYGEFDPFRTIYAAAVPSTAGTFAVGDRVVRNPPASGQPSAWACTVAGTMDTVHAGITATTTNGAAAVEVNETTDLALGQWITIATATGGPFRIYELTDATHIKVYPSPSNSVSGQAVDYQDATFIAEASLP